MDGRQVPPESTTWRTEGFTTLVLERNEFGQWRATQDGVDAVGYGETAQDAAADYCHAIEREADRDD